MKRIFASLFVVVAIVGVGVFATSAYFQTTESQTGFHLTTGTASLAITPNQDSSTLPVNGSPIMVGPGFDAYQCFWVQNDGNYPLDVTLTLSMSGASVSETAAIESALDLSINPNPTACTGYGTDYLLSAYPANPQSLGPTLAAGAGTFVVMRLHWDSAADQNNQNSLQGLNPALTINGTIVGTTPH